MSENVDPVIERQREVFLKALEQATPAECAQYLDAACGGDKALRAEVELLLKHQTDSSFLERPVAGAAGASPVDAITSETPGTMIGRYKLLEKLGEGGCGVVFMAEQEEPVRRKVALKIIKLGMDTRSVIARFEAERQALALMDHPNIAKVLDAGATETGRPYFVMELVGGIKITDYCEKNNLTIRQRLDLFMQVCHAIQHAHQKGIIHRDIKPSNVLVAEQDGVAVPKVIDFGIAKATQGKLTNQTVFTAFEQFLGTPAYMSPEQAQVGGLDVDTRSDIYSLGVLLYELLTGKTPFDAKELLAVGLEAMRRTICEKEPPTPSTRLTQERLAQRATGSDKLKFETGTSEIDRDLDWIVMKCLEKDRARRYETANGLARDIECHLSNEPVVASPPSNLYRLQKLVRRNRGTFAAMATILALLILGVGVSMWEAFRARRAERDQARLGQEAKANETRAEREAAKSQQEALLLKEMFAGVGPSRARGRDTAMLREILDNTAERLGKVLTNQPEVEIELRGTLADVYEQLGLYPQMEEMAKRRVSLARSAFGETNLTVASALGQLGYAFHYNATADSLKPLRQAVAIKRSVLSHNDPELARSLDALAFVLMTHHELGEAEKLAREALAIQRKASGGDRLDLVEALRVMGLTLNEAGRREQAEPLLLESFMVQTNLLGFEDPRVVSSLQALARVRMLQGKFDQAEATCRQALALEKRMVGQDHADVAGLLSTLGVILRNEGRLPEAEAALRESHMMIRKLLGLRHAYVYLSSEALVQVLLDERKYAEIESLIAEILPPPGEGVPGLRREILRMRARFLARLCRWKEAETDVSESIQIPPKSVETWQWQAALLAQTDQLQKYEQHRRMCMEFFGKTTDVGALATLANFCLLQPVSDAQLVGFADLVESQVDTNRSDLPWIEFSKGLVAYRKGVFSEAAQWAQKSLSATSPDPLRDVDCYMVLAMARHRLNQTSEAQNALATGLRVAEAKLPKCENGDISDGWPGLIVARILMREAVGVISDREGTVK